MSDSFENLNITRDELNTIGECIKKEEFRQLLNEYVKEVTDPENRKKYQDDIIQLEKERGVDITFLNPNPGFVIKTSQNGNMKVFINICMNENIQKPTSQVTYQDGKRGLNWSLPYAQAPPVQDLDKNKARCMVYDVLFHPQSLQMADANKEFKNLVIKTALNAVENNFDVKLDQLNIKFPKLSFKGLPKPTVIRKKSSVPPKEGIIDLKAYGCPYQTLEESEKLMEIHKQKVSEKENIKKKDENKQEKKFTTPKYIIKQRNNLDIQDFTLDRNAKMNSVFPKELVIEITVPLISSANEINLDIEEKRLVLKSKSSAKYYLDLILPFTVNEQEGSAKFDKATKKLTVVLHTKQRPLLKENSYESDSGYPQTDSSEDEEEEKNKACVNVEEISSTNFISEDSLQTKEINNSVCKTFLDSTIGYTFPTFACNSLDDQICFIIQIKNIDPSSLDYQLTSRTLHLKFHSIASGYFPQHYAFFLQLSERAIILKENVTLEPWDNNLTLTIKFDNFSNIRDSYFVGLDQESITKHYFNEANAILHKFKELEVLSDASISDDEIEEEINTTELNNEENSSIVTKSNEIMKESNDQESRVLNAPRPFERSYSESSFDEMNNPRPRGILKLSRSISESSSGFDDHLANLSEGETKKTVRFNSFVKQQLFRPTSSILGQKKKNQKRRQNKRSRKNSESENSDNENNIESTLNTIIELVAKNDVCDKSSELNKKQVCKKKQDRKQRNKNKTKLKPQLNIPPKDNMTNVDDM